MRKNKTTTGMIISGLILCAFISLSGCSATGSAKPPVTESTAVTESSDASESTAEPTEEADTGEIAAQPNEAADDKTGKTAKGIVWLGDSLTQGSLGDRDDNLANAPYVKLQEMVDIPVEGYGYYGYNTHDILWVYTDEDHLDQDIDPDKIYIFWVGSCDWAADGEPNSDTEPVINEVDSFLEKGGVKNYIMIGTTSRHALGDLYMSINRDLEAHYQDHYLDVIPIINQYGYSEDKTHLSQATYDAVAEAVYEKLKTLGYI